MAEHRTKLEAAARLRELSLDIMKPWSEIHGMILEIDGCHNRILGLGIKDYSLSAHDAILAAANALEDEHNRETRAKYIATDDQPDDKSPE